MNQSFDIKIFDLVLIILSGVIVLTSTALLFIFIVIKNKKNKQSYTHEKQKMQSQFQHALLQTQIEIQEQTLKTISQEIHDNIGQVLSLAKLNLNTFENMESADNQVKINNTKQLVSKAIIDLRNLSRSMYGDIINDMGLPDAIANELKMLQNTGQFQTSLEITGELFKMSAQKEMVVFRMVQEALNNTIKHAKATSINVRLKYVANAFSLDIIDDGCGIDLLLPDKIKNGMGLKSMQNRAAMIGGELRIESEKQKGTSIFFTITDAGNKTE